MASSPNGSSPTEQANTPRRSAGLMAAAQQLASAAVNRAVPKTQPDVDQLMSEYAAQNNNNPEALMHLLKVLEARKGKTDANVSLRHSVKIDTSMKAPVHHRRNIAFTFLSPLLLFEALSLLFWLVGLAGVADWQARNTKAMAVVSPNYQPPVAVGNLTATPLTLLTLKRDKYEPSYEWFIVWSSFFSACYMLYVTVCRSSLWQHACAMWFCSITTAISMTHCFYISQLVSLTRQLVTSKSALSAVEALYAGLIGWTLMNVLALAWMCSDIDHDIALDAATKKLEVQQEVARSRSNSRAPSRSTMMTPAHFLSPVSLSPRQPPPRVVSTDGFDVDRVLDEVLDDGSLAARSGLGRGSGAGMPAYGSALARAEEGRE